MNKIKFFKLFEDKNFQQGDYIFKLKKDILYDIDLFPKNMQEPLMYIITKNISMFEVYNPEGHITTTQDSSHIEEKIDKLTKIVELLEKKIGNVQYVNEQGVVENKKKVRKEDKTPTFIPEIDVSNITINTKDDQEIKQSMNNQIDLDI